MYRAWIERRPPQDVPPGPLMKKTHARARRLKRGLAEISGVRVKTVMSEALSAGLVCVEVAGLAADEVVDRLREEHNIVASVTPYATRYLRFGPSIANDEEDVDRAIAAVRSIARR